MLSHACYRFHLTLPKCISSNISTDFGGVSEQARHTNCVDRGVAHTPLQLLTVLYTVYRQICTVLYVVQYVGTVAPHRLA